MARLVVNPGSPVAWEIQLKPGANFIGRGFANDFKIQDPSVSSSHAQIVVSDQGVVLKDLGSTNGTFVNRAPVKEMMLQPGQTVHLGGVEMAFLTDGPAPAGPARLDLAPIGAAAPAPVARAVVARAVVAGAPMAVATAAPVAVATAAPVAVATAAPVAPAVRVTALKPRTSVLPAQAAVPVPVAPPVAAAASLEVPVPVAPPPVVAAGGGQCKFHQKTRGRFLCNTCHNYFCDLCVTSRTVAGVAHRFCRHCGTECVQVQVASAAMQMRGGGKSFFARLPGAFVYPLRGTGVLVLVVAAIIFGLLNWMTGGTRYGLLPRYYGRWTFFAQVFALGYFFAYMQSIIHSTAVEEKELPPLPSMGDFWQDILLPCLQLIGLTLCCFAPAIAVGWYAAANEDSGLAPVIIGAFALGALYFPMAFLAVAMLDSVVAANPLQVIPSILKAPVEYFVAIILLAAVLGMRWLGDEMIPVLFPRGLTTHSMAKLAAYLSTQAFWGLASLYLLTVGMHILGLVYVSKKDKLGWLSH